MIFVKNKLIVKNLFLCFSVIALVNACGGKSTENPPFVDNVSNHRWKLDSFSCESGQPVLASVFTNSPTVISAQELVDEILKTIKSSTLEEKDMYSKLIFDMFSDKDNSEDKNQKIQKKVDETLKLLGSLPLNYDFQFSLRLAKNQLDFIFELPSQTLGAIDLHTYNLLQFNQTTVSSTKIELIDLNGNKDFVNYSLSGKKLSIFTPKNENSVQVIAEEQKNYFSLMSFIDELKNHELENFCVGSRTIIHMTKI